MSDTLEAEAGVYTRVKDVNTKSLSVPTVPGIIACAQALHCNSHWLLSSVMALFTEGWFFLIQVHESRVIEIKQVVVGCMCRT